MGEGIARTIGKALVKLYNWAEEPIQETVDFIRPDDPRKELNKFKAQIGHLYDWSVGAMNLGYDYAIEPIGSYVWNKSPWWVTTPTEFFYNAVTDLGSFYGGIWGSLKGFAKSFEAVGSSVLGMAWQGMNYGYDETIDFFSWKNNYENVANWMGGVAKKMYMESPFSPRQPVYEDRIPDFGRWVYDKITWYPMRS